MAFQDLREFLTRLDEEKEISRIQAEVDWDLEIGAISRRAIELRAPALLFEKVRGYAGDYRVLANLLSGSRPTHARLAIALGLPRDTPPLELIATYREKSKNRIKPVRVDTGPCKEEIHMGEEVNLLEFPVPLIHGRDGGRYLGTWHIDVNKDPDTGWVNWATYRHMIHDEKTLGWLAVPFQHGPSIYYEKYESRGQPMPMAIAIGMDPVYNVVANTAFPYGVCEADVIGGVRGTPVEVVKCETLDLEVPANAEIVLEGVVLPGERKLEGPFGEYTGYEAGARMPRPVLRVQCITHRKNPILTMCNPGKPWEEDAVMDSITVSAMLENELEARGIPFKSVYVVPPALGVVVAVKPPYGGFAQTVASAIWASKPGFSRSYIFVVGEDVDVTNPEDVLWCLTTRLHPQKGIHIQSDAPGSPLRPFLGREEKEKGMAPRVLFDATFPHHWTSEDTPEIIDFEHGWPQEVRDKVLARWAEYGVGS